MVDYGWCTFMITLNDIRRVCEISAVQKLQVLVAPSLRASSGLDLAYRLDRVAASRFVIATRRCHLSDLSMFHRIFVQQTRSEIQVCTGTNHHLDPVR